MNAPIPDLQPPDVPPELVKLAKTRGLAAVAAEIQIGLRVDQDPGLSALPVVILLSTASSPFLAIARTE